MFLVYELLQKSIKWNNILIENRFTRSLWEKSVPILWLSVSVIFFQCFQQFNCYSIYTIWNLFISNIIFQVQQSRISNLSNYFYTLIYIPNSSTFHKTKNAWHFVLNTCHAAVIDCRTVCLHNRNILAHHLTAMPITCGLMTGTQINLFHKDRDVKSIFNWSHENLLNPAFSKVFVLFSGCRFS